MLERSGIAAAKGDCNDTATKDAGGLAGGVDGLADAHVQRPPI